MTHGDAAEGEVVVDDSALRADDPADDEVEAALLEADLRELAAERDELRGTAQRIQADFENYR